MSRTTAWPALLALSAMLSCNTEKVPVMPVQGTGTPVQKETGADGPSLQDMEMSLRAGTFNIRCISSSDTGYRSWEFRKDNVIGIIEDNGFDIIGLQEVSASERDYMKPRMSEKYGFHLTGRDDGDMAGESVGILWLLSRFEPVDKGRFFLSETPETAGSPYPGWTSSDPGRNRITAWVKLKDKESGMKILAISTHLEVSKTDELTIRRKSAELICSYLETINSEGLPVILAGDMNSKPTEETNAIFRNTFADSYLEAEKNGVREGFKGTFNGHNYTPEDYLDTQGLRIDYIYLKGDMNVTRYRVIDDRYNGYWPSDHCPVMAGLTVRDRQTISDNQ